MHYSRMAGCEIALQEHGIRTYVYVYVASLLLMSHQKDMQPLVDSIQLGKILI